MSEFDAMAFGVSVLKSKGYDTTVNNDAADIFMIQKDTWVNLYEKHRLGERPDHREELLRDFAAKPFIGGVGRVLEAFSAFADSRSHHAPEPNWQEAAREFGDCGYCENRGVISNIPVMSASGAFDGDREYSFRCVCHKASVVFGSLPQAQDWMLRFAADRNRANCERLRQWRQKHGLDMDDEASFRAGFRRWMDSQKGGLFRSAQEAAQGRHYGIPVNAKVKTIIETKERKGEEAWTESDESVCMTW
jgi:hypothetical protein